MAHVPDPRFLRAMSRTSLWNQHLRPLRRCGDIWPDPARHAQMLRFEHRGLTAIRWSGFRRAGAPSQGIQVGPGDLGRSFDVIEHLADLCRRGLDLGAIFLEEPFDPSGTLGVVVAASRHGTPWDG